MVYLKTVAVRILLMCLPVIFSQDCDRGTQLVIAWVLSFVFTVHEIIYCLLFSFAVCIHINSTESTLVVGGFYTLFCSISGDYGSTDGAACGYQWTKDNGTLTKINTSSDALAFAPFKSSDAGNYSCRTNKTSDDNCENETLLCSGALYLQAKR